MPEFVGDDPTQNHRKLKLGIINFGTTLREVVVDARQSRMDGKAEYRVLELVLNGCWQYAQPEVGGLRGFLAGSGRFRWLGASPGIPARLAVIQRR